MKKLLLLLLIFVFFLASCTNRNLDSYEEYRYREIPYDDSLAAIEYIKNAYVFENAKIKYKVDNYFEYNPGYVYNEYKYSTARGALGFTSESLIHDIDNVTLNVYYGLLLEPFYTKEELNHFYTDIDVDVAARNNVTNKEYTLFSIDNLEKTKIKYKTKKGYISKSFRDLDEIDGVSYSLLESKTVVLPKEIFVEGTHKNEESLMSAYDVGTIEIYFNKQYSDKGTSLYSSFKINYFIEKETQKVIFIQDNYGSSVYNMIYWWSIVSLAII